MGRLTRNCCRRRRCRAFAAELHSVRPPSTYRRIKVALTRRLQRFLSVLLYVAWVAGAVIVTLTAVTLPYDPGASGPAHRHLQNSPGTIAFVGIVSILEIVTLTAYLRPWRDGNLARRAVRSFLALGLWTALWLNYTIGSGPVIGLHATHLFLQWCLLGILAVASRIVDGSHRPEGPIPPPGAD